MIESLPKFSGEASKLITRMKMDLINFSKLMSLEDDYALRGLLSIKQSPGFSGYSGIIDMVKNVNHEMYLQAWSHLLKFVPFNNETNDMFFYGTLSKVSFSFRWHLFGIGKKNYFFNPINFIRLKKKKKSMLNHLNSHPAVLDYFYLSSMYLTHSSLKNFSIETNVKLKDIFFMNIFTFSMKNIIIISNSFFYKFLKGLEKSNPVNPLKKDDFQNGFFKDYFKNPGDISNISDIFNSIDPGDRSLVPFINYINYQVYKLENPERIWVIEKLMKIKYPGSDRSILYDWVQNIYKEAINERKYNGMSKEKK